MEGVTARKRENRGLTLDKILSNLKTTYSF